MKATADGRCFLCVQRFRYYPDIPKVLSADEFRHLLHPNGEPLCSLPKPGRTKRDPEYQREHRRRWAAKPGVKAWRKITQRWWQDLRRLYGIGPAEWINLYNWQGGRCASCWQGPAATVDHDHSTGEVRALLCGPCNLMIGHAKDDPRKLLQGAAYLLRPEPLKHRTLTLVRELVTAGA